MQNKVLYFSKKIPAICTTPITQEFCGEEMIGLYGRKSYQRDGRSFVHELASI